MSISSLPVTIFVLAFLCFSVGPRASAEAPPEIRRYDVMYATTPPVIDGQVDAQEWESAAAGGDAWRLLREGRSNPLEPNPPQDAHNSQFKMLWDANAIYLLITSDYGGWRSRPAANAQGRYQVDFSGMRDAVSIYFDPNTDGESNFPPASGQHAPHEVVDGYEIAFNLYMGSFECGVDSPCTSTNPNTGTPFLNQGPTFGTFGEAHVNTLFGNQARWTGMKATHINQANDADGGVIEMKIPWSEFDADEVGTAGLKHPQAPASGDTWFFQMGGTRTDNQNFLPVWNWTTSDYFAAHPHGEITFIASPSAPADFDKDGDVDGDDFLIWQSNFGTPDQADSNTGDADGDGDVDGDDFLLWQADFDPAGSRDSAALPEPTTALLVLNSLVALACGAGLCFRHQ